LLPACLIAASRRRSPLTKLQHVFGLPPVRRARTLQSMGRTSGVVMRPVELRGHWRVQITWREGVPRYFGKFDSEAEAERWISEHRWLTKQDLERQVDPPENS